ncbi:MAG: DUF452 family protein [Muribaculaceae bacterium]|nr:DUF452 family protein [Muribaculaceae bacterium]
MEYKIIADNGTTRLLLIFAGWGMDDAVFRNIVLPGYDVMVVWDYRSFHIDWSCIGKYSEVCLLAWSMGVFAATQTTQAIEYKITRRIAVNGTPTPVDDSAGIPEAVFYGTLDGLDEPRLAKFRRRMCATRGDFESFSAAMPQRGVDELRDELQAIADRLILSVPSDFRWDLAIIGLNDRIFPPVNQRRAWQQAGVPIKAFSTGHYTDFKAIVTGNFIDKAGMSRRFAEHVDSYTEEAVVQNQIVDRIFEIARREGIVRRLRDERCNILEIGSGAGTLSRLIAREAALASVTLWDLAAPCPRDLPRRVDFLQCDAELQMPRLRASSIDIIFSASTMQWFNSPDRFLYHCARVLKPGGVALLSTFTVGNMHQISDITGKGLPLMKPEQLIEMASVYLHPLYTENWSRDLDFDSPLEVLRHLRLTGVNSLGGGTINPLKLVRRYPMMLDGRYHLTYCPMIMILTKE